MSGAPAREPVKVEYWVSFTERQLGNYQTLIVDAFARAHPTLRLLFAQASTSAQLLALIAAGTPPDITASAKPKEYMTGQVQDIAPLVKRDRYNVAAFPKETFDSESRWKERIINLPNEFGGTWPVMPYNKDLFRQAGVPEPPTRWGDPRWNAESWLHALQRTTRLDGKAVSYGINQPNMRMLVVFWPWLWKTSWISDDLRTITCDTPQMIEAMEYLINLATKHRALATDVQLREAIGATAEQAFISGNLAMYATAGSRLVIAVAQAVRDQGLPAAYAPLPTLKAFRAAQHLNGNGLVPGARQPEGGWTFIKWSAETPNWAISRGNPPPREEHFDLWAREVYGGLEAAMRIEVYRESLRHSAKRDPLENLPSFDQMQQGLITPAFNRLWAGEASVAATLKELKAPLQAFVPKELPN